MDALKRRILIVDDNHDSAVSLSMMLSLMGNDTRTAHDGVAAVEAADDFRPDVMLLDIGLPRLNGYDACRQIRQQDWARDMLIVALTGWGQDEDRRRSAEAGFNEHLVKPVEMAALEELLSQYGNAASCNETPATMKEQLRILVVDDMRDAAYLLSMLLQAAGHDVRTAADGPTGLAVAIDYQPDVALLDISLPGMSGLEVARRIRERPELRDMLLVAMTGYSDEADRQRSFDAGFNHHLVKPADIHVLQQILATVQ